ncbi:hypothetical protein ACKWMZ_28575 [Pseudomonas protegens]|uniref:YobI family P-loop NTPase n=1 Tax=Pseudomonas protegens TaxID=380021 RepID=UPI003966E6BA
MLHKFLTNVRHKCLALAVTWEMGCQLFRTLLRASVSQGSFEPLTPVLVEKDQFQYYERELIGALNNDEVLNIALTGGYGAGKSSVIKTFFERHPEFKAAYVSLATFSKDAPSHLPISEDEQPSGPNFEKEQFSDRSQEFPPPGTLINSIEETIVQQLLYTVPATRLPKTRLKRITQERNTTTLFRTAAIAGLILGGLRLYIPTIKELPKSDPDWLFTSFNIIPDWLAITGVAVGFSYLIHAFSKLVSIFNIDGLTIKGGKLEATRHSSVLHKNLDEIIYCFERSSIRVVIIEDLDRFGMQEIFFRLREINFTIRHAPQIKRPIHFIYAIRDELFTITDKTKFFDLIIPIIPIVNSENSREKLYEMMNKRSVKGQPLGMNLDPVLVETVCYYIDEMRLIKNIVNEYDISVNLLSSGALNLDRNKLFSIVAIRNLHPDEFVELSRRRGKIYAQLTGLSTWATNKATSYEEKIQSLYEEKVQCENEFIKTLTELRLLVWGKALQESQIQGANYIRINGSNFDLDKFISDEIFDNACHAEHWVAVSPTAYSNHYSEGTALNPKRVLAAVDYHRRSNLIQRPIAAIQHSIKKIEDNVLKLKNISFREAARSEYGDTISKNLQGMEMVVYLMRNSYLDTDYIDYLSFFYEGSLTHDDQNFLLALRRRTVLDVATKIRNPARVVDKLEYNSLEGSQGIIAALIEELVITAQPNDAEDIRTQKLNVILESASKDFERLTKASQILLSGNARAKFIKAVFIIRPNIFSLLLLRQFKTDDAKQDLICGIMDNLSEKDVDKLSASILHGIESLEKIEKLIPGLQSRSNGWSWLRNLPVRFEKLTSSIDETSLRLLVEWGCLKLTLPTMSILCRAIDGDEGVSYRRLKSLDFIGLDKLILTAPKGFVKALLEQPEGIKEDSKSLKHLLSLINDEPELQDELLNRTDCNFEDLDGLSDNILISAIQLDRVSSVPQAAWTFYIDMIVRPKELPSDAPSSNEIDYLEDILTSFLARNISFSQFLWDEERPESDELKLHLIASDNFDEDTLRQIFSKTTVGVGVIEGACLSESRWKFLASSNFVPFNSELQTVFANESPDLEISYLIANWPTAREELALRKMDPFVVAGLSKASSIPIEDIIKMWEGLVENDTADDFGAMQELGSVCIRANTGDIVLPLNCRTIIIKAASDPNTPELERKALLLQALKLKADWAATSTILSMLSDGYVDIAAKKRLVHVPNSDLDIFIMTELQTRGFLGKVKNGKYHIDAYSKPSGMV